MKNYVVGALILIAIIAADGCLPLSAGCVAAALVLGYVKTPHTN